MSAPRRPATRPGAKPTARSGAGRTGRAPSTRSATRPAAPDRTVRATEPEPPPPPPARVSLTGRAAILALVLVIVALSFAIPFRAWITQRSDLAQLRASAEDDQRAIDDLQAQLERWKDPEFVKAQARDRLRFVMPGDIGFVVIDSADAVPELEAQEAADTVWWERLWTSVEDVDATTDPLATG